MIDPLIEAYARGARALGQSAPASLLDAADYTSNTRAVVPGPDAFATPGWDDLAVEDEPARPLPRAFTAPSEPESQAADKVHDEGARGAASSTQARIKPFAATSGWRSGLLLSLVLALLFGAGYLTVSIFLTQSHTPGPADVATVPRSQASTERVRIVPIAASSREAMALQEAALAPHDGARPGERAEELPAAIGAASLRQAAVNGDLLAQFEVASRFADGRGVAQNDAQAFVWFQRAATHGFVPAQFRLAGLFERGAGVTADAERAKVWYRRAAEQGHVKAMHNLAVLSARKDADRADFVLAAKWFQEAADRGLTDSQYNLALLYQKGLGVEKNLFQAYKWFALAARGGDKEAAGRLEQIKSQLAPGDLIAAEQVLSVWQVRAAEADAGIKAATPVGGDDVGG